MGWGGLSLKMSKRSEIVKKMPNCQKDVKYQKVKYVDYGGGSQKINWHNEVHTYWHQFWCQIWRSDSKAFGPAKCKGNYTREENSLLDWTITNTSFTFYPKQLAIYIKIAKNRKWQNKISHQQHFDG